MIYSIIYFQFYTFNFILSKDINIIIRHWSFRSLKYVQPDQVIEVQVIKRNADSQALNLFRITEKLLRIISL
ncbi:hypothetical protein [Flavitalea sp.]